MNALDLSRDALQTFLQTLTGQDAPLVLEPPVVQPTHQSLLDTSAQMLLLFAQSPGLSVAVWLHPGWLALCGQAMLGEPMKAEDEGADDLLREVSAQAFGSVRSQLGAAEMKLPQLTFSLLGDPRELNLPDTTTLVRFEMMHDEQKLDGLALITSEVEVPADLPAAAPPAASAAPASAAPPRPAPIPVSAASFRDIGNEQMGDGRDGNMDLLVDVELEVVVELGRRRLPLADVLRLSAGSVIELEKLMGEPLEVYANGKLIAEGEAVVIDEQFGIRITSIAAKRRREKVFL